MKVKRSKKGLAALLALCMVLFAVPFTAQAAENSVTLDISKGNITITSTGYTAEGATSETPFTGDYHIMQANPNVNALHVINVNSGTHNITFDNLKTYGDSSGGTAVTDGRGFFEIRSATVHLTLVGRSTVDTSRLSLYAVYIASDSTLTIAGTGELRRVGGKGPTFYNEGRLVVNGGILFANSNGNDIQVLEHAALEINDGVVYAAGGSNYGIGNEDGTAGSITINGGSVLSRTMTNTSKPPFGDVNGEIRPINSSGTSLYRTEIQLGDKSDTTYNGLVSSIEGLPAEYGIRNTQSFFSGSYLYLYLPTGTTLTKVTLADGRYFEGTVTTGSDDTASAVFSYAGTNPKEEHSATITAKATIPSPTYTVTIPATVEVGELVQKASNASDKIKSTPLTVSATSVNNLFGQKKVNVAVSTADGNFKLADGSNKLAYSVFSAATGGSALTSGATFAEFTAAGDNTGRIEIDQSAIDRAGNYTGTLTFTISLSDVSA